jgi:hypothetical protein
MSDDLTTRWRMSSTGLEPHPKGEWVRYVDAGCVMAARVIATLAALAAERTARAQAEQERDRPQEQTLSVVAAFKAECLRIGELVQAAAADKLYMQIAAALSPQPSEPSHAVDCAAREPALAAERTARAQAEPVTPLQTCDPTWCSCPRYPNGGRKEPDPLCPLHAGDARD